MPTIANSNIPTPKSWDEFEDITLSASKLRWQSTNFFRYGRQGQKQDGVDIWGHDDDGKLIGVQCKNTVNKVSLATIKQEIKNAEEFDPISRLYIATTARRDGPLQKDVRAISKVRHDKSKFRVDILFWDDICLDLAKDDDVFFQHYPQFKSTDNGAKEHDKKLFGELTALLNSKGVIGFLDQTNMAGFAFRETTLDPLREFYYDWSKPEREFITPELEALKKALWSKVDAYYSVYATSVFPARNAEFSSVPPEWEYAQPDRFKEAVDALHSLAGEVVELHAQLVRAGRHHLLGAVR